jgi:two-component system NarL family sensor kinase
VNLRERLSNRDGELFLRLKLVGIATVPLILAVAALVWFVVNQANESKLAIFKAVQPIVMQSKRDELQHFVQAGRKVISHFCEIGKANPGAMREGLELVRHMDFGDKSNDNYFFIYELNGTVVMHPRLPIEGKIIWDKKDRKGKFVIQELIAAAKAGGGFVDYWWNRPSTGQDELKLGYVELVPECNWMIGTGLYVDSMKSIEETIQEITRREVENTRDKILLIALAALLLVAAGGLAINLSEQRHANERLRIMAQKVVQSQEAERARVARELHDGILQSLASLKYVLETGVYLLDNGNLPSGRKLLGNVVMQTSAVMTDVRHISHGLHDSRIDDIGLGATVERLGQDVADRTGLSAEIAIDPLPKIQGEAATSMLRVIEQALVNIENHAKASRFRIGLRVKDGLSLLVEDNGVGFDVKRLLADPRDGIGLQTMRERIEMLGGSFAIESEPGRTAVKAFLPPEFFEIA